MLSFVSLCPHPPIIVPGVTPEKERQKASRTIRAMEKLSRLFQKAQIQNIVLLSPHGPFDFQRMTLLFSPETKGGFQDFGVADISLSFQGDLEISRDLVQQAEQADIPLRVVMGEKLDNGASVPLYFLTKNQKEKPKLIELVYSALDQETHLKLGQIIYQVIQESPQRTAFIASGDLSHRLTENAPAGYSPSGKLFDNQILKFLKQKDVASILDMNSELIEEAGECGYRSILVLLGLLNELGADKWRPKILSYEYPFGVGYAVANFVIKNS